LTALNVVKAASAIPGVSKSPHPYIIQDASKTWQKNKPRKGIVAKKYSSLWR